jgi:hypothetical protein
MNPLTFVTSGAYVNQELTAEFGLLPPAFLPVGSARLYELQMARLQPGHVYMTVPESYAVSPRDAVRLKQLGVELLWVPDNLRLGEAVVYAINYVGTGDAPINILHGDTLVDEMPADGKDLIGVGENSGGYAWAEVALSDGRVASVQTVDSHSAVSLNPIACGCFAFSSSAALVRAITRARGDFIGGINLYAAERPMTAARISSWLDFGHVQTFFHSRRVVTQARSFNVVHIDGKIARKSSGDSGKIEAEAAWLRNIPPAIQIYAARLIDAGKTHHGAFYATEYEYLPSLSELFVFAALDKATWLRIIRCCGDFLSACANVHGTGSADETLRELAGDKTARRLEQFARENAYDIDRELRFDGEPMPSLRRIADEITTLIDFKSGRGEAVMHGDFCFGNILYDSRVHRLKVIDPRGYVSAGCPSIYGDGRYDLAKLSHSIVGRYDHLIAGCYEARSRDPYDLMISFETAPHNLWLEAALGDLTVKLAAIDLASGAPAAAQAKFETIDTLWPGQGWVTRGLFAAAVGTANLAAAATHLRRLSELEPTPEARFWAFERALDAGLDAEAEYLAGLIRTGDHADSQGFWAQLLTAAYRLQIGYLGDAAAICAPLHEHERKAGLALRMSIRVAHLRGDLDGVAELRVKLATSSGTVEDIGAAFDAFLFQFRLEDAGSFLDEMTGLWPVRTEFCQQKRNQLDQSRRGVDQVIANLGRPDPFARERIAHGLRRSDVSPDEIMWSKLSLMARLSSDDAATEKEIREYCGVHFINWEQPEIGAFVMFQFRKLASGSSLFRSRDLMFHLDRRWFGDAVRTILSAANDDITDDVCYGAIFLLRHVQQGLLPERLDAGELQRLTERLSARLPACSAEFRSFILPQTDGFSWAPHQWPQDASAYAGTGNASGIRRGLTHSGGRFARELWRQPGVARMVERRVAVVISGQLRGFAQAWPTMLDHLIRPLRADVVLSTWNRTSNAQGRHAGRLGRALPTELLRRLPEDRRHTDVFEAQFPRTAALLFESAEFGLDELRLLTAGAGSCMKAVELEDDRPFENAFAHYGHPFDPNQLKMFYRMSRGDELLRGVEQETGIAYTHVVWTRPDVQLLGPIGRMEKVTSGDKTAFSAWSTARVFGDHLFVVPREAFRAIGRIFPTLAIAGDNNLFGWRPSRYANRLEQDDNSFLMGPEMLNDTLSAAGYLCSLLPGAVRYRLVGYVSNLDAVMRSFEEEAGERAAGAPPP